MNQRRPVNLNLFTIRFPLPAIISILHRISGFVLFLIIPLVLWLLETSLTQSGFDSIQQWLGNFFVKCIFWVLLMPFCYHLVAGIRHLLMDIEIGVSLNAGRFSALITLIISAVLILLVGIWLW